MERPTYTSEEMKSYLPTGWALADFRETEWNAKKGVLTFYVLDNVDFDWPVRVKAADVDEKGRLEALGHALDDVFRQRLGRPTRGMGWATSA